jgi:uncharacterized membrane protein YedE/YeeE
VKTLVAYLLVGALFGAGLAISGMTNPGKVLGFLDIFGAWDPSLALVMVGAIGAYFLAIRVSRGRSQPVFGGSFPGPPSQKVEARTLLGAAIFGLGWGWLGFCPGPAIANLGALRPEALGFVPAMLAGMLVAQRVLGADR